MARYWQANSKAGFRLRKSRCPRCDKPRLTRYFDRKTNELMDEEFGRCERVNSCGYDNDPNRVLRHEGEFEYRPKPLPPPKPERTDWRCPEEVFNSTFRDHSRNNLMHWLRTSLGEAVEPVLMDYRVGTYTGRRTDLHGAAMFWQIDIDGGIRTGHAMLYGSDGRRDKVRQEVDNCWAHHGSTGKSLSELGGAECFFGEHLLRERPEAVVCVVESEKTALVAACFYPGAIWLACGGKDKLTRRTIRALKGRDVILFPDIDAYTNWCDKADDYEAYFLVEGSLKINGAIIGVATKEERESTMDLADFLVPTNRLENIRIFEPEEMKEGAPLEPIAEPVQASSMPPVLARMIAYNPAVQTLLDELDVDTENITIKPL